ncbi:hypothetical protein [Algoriphagus taiwanensis]|uniref:Lipocalin-like domain-containing protein n=1 Tax=Algoriphagus taiwanensis TaxID=1445656 RepID=A0ABQ6Q0M3_9BACT|nr:hypothetical protein Ataiwa_16890 [Algoriphagus taiwanensis]
MNFHLLLIFALFFQNYFELEGKWQLVHFSGFDTFIQSDNFQYLTEEEKLQVFEGNEYVLNNTKYLFKGDSVFFTNATANFTSSEQKGRFFMKSDTMIIFYEQKLNPMKLFISFQSDTILKLRFVKNGGILGPTEMTFQRAE